MISLLQAWLPLPAGVGVEAPGNEGAPEAPRGWGAGKGEAALTWPMTGAILMTIPDCEEEAPVSAPPSWERRVVEAGGGGGPGSCHPQGRISPAQLSRMLRPRPRRTDSVSLSLLLPSRACLSRVQRHREAPRKLAVP